MDIYEFMSNNPALTLFLACIIGLVITYVITSVITSVFQCIFLCFNRLMRHTNIKNEGWPPPHLDADGDFINKEK